MHAQSHPSLYNPMDCGPPDSSVHGTSQVRILLLMWVAISCSRGSSRLRDRTHVGGLLHWQAGSLPLGHQGSGREAQEGGNICILMVDSCFVHHKLAQHCKAIILQLKKKKKKKEKKERSTQTEYINKPKIY